VVQYASDPEKLSALAPVGFGFRSNANSPNSRLLLVYETEPSLSAASNGVNGVSKLAVAFCVTRWNSRPRHEGKRGIQIERFKRRWRRPIEWIGGSECQLEVDAIGVESAVGER